MSVLAVPRSMAISSVKKSKNPIESKKLYSVCKNTLVCKCSKNYF
jgi:hypothetical protein